jgi:hypothetical protein
MDRYLAPAVLTLALLAGCASMSESDCRTTNWHARGEADGLGGQRAQIDLYAEQCARFAVTPDEKAYLAGWGAGYAEWNRRVSRGRT